MIQPAPPDPDSALGYIRMSMYREEAISPELQRSAIEDRAARDGVHIPEENWIVELGVTGRDFARKGIQDAIERVETGKIKRVYVWKFSRFGRNAMLVAFNNARIEEAGGRLVSATEDIDATTAVGKLARGMIHEIDEFQSNIIGEQWQEAHAKRRKNGLPHNGAPRQGYVYHRPTIGERVCPQGCPPRECEPGYVPDPETAPIVEEMYLRYNRGESNWMIARWLNETGVTTTQGRVWNLTSLKRFMDTGWAAGLLRVHDRECSCTNRQSCRNHIYLPAAHDAIISARTWQAYLVNSARRRRLPPRVEQALYPLTGRVRCGRCGKPMWAQGTTSHGRTYNPGYMYKCSLKAKAGPQQCPGSFLARHRLENAVLAWVADVAAADVQRRAALAKTRSTARTSAAADRERLTREDEKLTKALVQLTIDKAKRLIPDEAYAAARDEIQADQAKTRRSLDKIAEQIVHITQPHVKVAQGLIEEWPTMSGRSRNQILATLIKEIRVTSHGVGTAADVELITTWGETVSLDLNAEAKALDEEIARRYAAGESTKQISAALGKGNSYAWKRLAAMGIQRRPSGGQPGPRPRRAAKEH